MFFIGHAIEETLIARDTLNFLFQQLAFVLNLNKSLLTPAQRIEFLGVKFGSISWNTRWQLLQNTFQVLWLWRHVGSLETSGSHQNGNFDQKFFNKSARRRERPKNICLYQGCFNNYFSTLLGHPILSFRESMRYSRFGAIISSMHFPRFALFYKSCKKSVTTKQKKCCLSHQLGSLKSCTPSTRNVYSLSTATSKEHKLNKTTRGCSSSNYKQNITTSGVDHIRERLLKKGVSETAAKLIANTRRTNLQTNYNSSWRMWASWCDKQQVDAFRCDAI